MNSTRTLCAAEVMACALLTACGQTVPVRSQFYYPQAQTQVVITETITCTPTKDGVSISYSASPATNYVRDLNSFSSLDLEQFGGAWIDPDISVGYTADGRLSTINATETGQASTVIKDAIEVATAVSPFFAEVLVTKKTSKRTIPNAPRSGWGDVCTSIEKVTGTDDTAATKKVVTPPGSPGTDAPKKSPPPSIVLTHTVNLTYTSERAKAQENDKIHNGNEQAYLVWLTADPLSNPNIVIPPCTVDIKTNEKDCVAHDAATEAVTEVKSMVVGLDPTSFAMADQLKLTQFEAQSVRVAQGTDESLQALEPPITWCQPDKTSKDTYPKSRCQPYDPPKFSPDNPSLPLSKEQEPPSGFARLRLNKVVPLPIQIAGWDPNTQGFRVVWRGYIDVPIRDYYYILVPTGSGFGTHKFSLALSGSGAITSIEYNSSGSTGQAFDAANSILGAKPKTPSQADQDAAKSNAIYQKARLDTCMKDPENCKSN